MIEIERGLIYPRNHNEIDQLLPVRGSNIVILEKSIDLRESRASIEQGFDELARDLIQIRPRGRDRTPLHPLY